MRALLSHPARLLTSCFAVLTLLAHLAAAQLPRPIGPVSDYGAVLDRAGRDHIGGLVTDALARHGVSVHILVSWEDPYADADRFASELLVAWALDRAATILVVFVRYGTFWESRVRIGSETRRIFGSIEGRLQREIAELTEHRRIEEAMVTFFAAFDRAVAGNRRAIDARSAGMPRWVLALAVGGAFAALAVLVHCRVCPRCGRILRVRPSPFGRDLRVYYCQRCGYSRRAR